MQEHRDKVCFVYCQRYRMLLQCYRQIRICLSCQAFRISTIILPILTSNITQNFLHIPLTFLHLCLPKAASNTREHYYILILLCFSVFCPCFDFPLVRIFSSHFYYFLLQSMKNRIQFQLQTKATATPSFNGLASTLPFYFHLIRNRFSRSHANKTDDNLLSNTPIF